MSIRRRLFYLLNAVVLVFGLAVFALWWAEEGRMDAIENARVRERSTSLDRSLDQWASTLENFAAISAGAPSLYEAVKNGNPDRIDAQLPEATMAVSRVASVWVCRVDGTALFVRNSLYSTELDQLPIPRNALATLFTDQTKSARFFVKSSAGVVEIAGRPIAQGAKGNESANVIGYLFAGRLWDDAELKQMSLYTGNALRLVDLAYSERQLVLPSGEIAFTRPLDSWDGKTVARLLARNDSPLLRHVDRLRWALWFMVAAFGVTMTLTVAFALKRWVWTPMRSLLQSLRTEEPAKVKSIEKDSGEVGQLARLIGTFFEQRDSLMKEISEQRHAEREHRAQEHQSTQSQKIDAIGRLASGVAHEFNNLLTTIIGYTGILQERFRDDPAVSGDLEQIMKAGERATGLTRQLLSFSRKQVIHPTIIDLNEVILGMEPGIRMLAGEQIETRIGVEAAPGSVRADVTQIEQIVKQLVSNARDAMPDGGILTVATASTLVPERTWSQGLELPPGRYVTLEVSDTGAGMDDATKERLFEPFFTTKRPGKGNGLGLAMVYGVVQQSSGAIAVSSNPGCGTTIRVHLPLVVAEAVPEMAQPSLQTRPNPKRKGETALALIADTGVLALVTSVLNEQGMNVLQASNRETALVAAQNHRGEIRLIIADLLLPEGSSQPIIDEVKQEYRQAEALYLSGVGDEVNGALKMAADLDILEKPFSPAALAKRVKDILRGRVPG